MADPGALAAGDGSPPTRPPGKSWLRECFDALLVALVFAVLARTWVVQAFKIPTASMAQNLLVGDHILVNKFIYGPVRSPLEQALLPMRPLARGDVAVFKFPEDPARDFIKRCVGLPGDEVDLVDKALHVNGGAVEERAYAFFTDPVTYPDSLFVPEHYRARDQFGAARVPPESYFCLGDNRDESHDSRFWGAVPREHLKGRALLIYWSVAGGDPPAAAAPAGGGRWWHSPGEALGRLRSAARWDRTFTLVR